MDFYFMVYKFFWWRYVLVNISFGGNKNWRKKAS